MRPSLALHARNDLGAPARYNVPAISRAKNILGAKSLARQQAGRGGLALGALAIHPRNDILHCRASTNLENHPPFQTEITVHCKRYDDDTAECCCHWHGRRCLCGYCPSLRRCQCWGWALRHWAPSSPVNSSAHPLRQQWATSVFALMVRQYHRCPTTLIGPSSACP